MTFRIVVPSYVFIRRLRRVPSRRRFAQLKSTGLIRCRRKFRVTLKRRFTREVIPSQTLSPTMPLLIFGSLLNASVFGPGTGLWRSGLSWASETQQTRPGIGRASSSHCPVQM